MKERRRTNTRKKSPSWDLKLHPKLGGDAKFQWWSMVGLLCFFFVFLWEIHGDPLWPMTDGQAYLAHDGIFGDHDLQSGQGPAEQDPTAGREKGGA